MNPTSSLRRRASSRRESPARFLPPSKCSRVLLPAPEAPRNARKSPRRSSTSTPRRTSSERLPNQYVLWMALAESSTSFIAQRLHGFEPARAPCRNHAAQNANQPRAAANQQDVARNDQRGQFREPVNRSREKLEAGQP